MSTRNLRPFQFLGYRSLIIPGIFFTVLFFLPAAIVMALPTGENVEDGSATFERPNDSTLNVTTSDKVIIRWNSFDIASHETVNFYQPAAASAALNRIMSGSMTSIAGNLNANGMIVLVNPSGISIAQTANIHVGSLIASSLNISNADFMSGRYRFVKNSDLPAGLIINKGNISVADGGLVGLFGGKVENDGKIVAKKGTIALVGGNKTTLTFGEQLREGLVSVTVEEGVDINPAPATDGTLSEGVTNSGELDADGGKVVLTARQLNSVFDHLVSQVGIIRANSVVEYSGIVELFALEGKLHHAGTTMANGTFENVNAGSISMRGMDIDLAGTAQARALPGGSQGTIEIMASNNIHMIGDLLSEAGRMSLTAGHEFRQDAGTVLRMTEGDISIQAAGDVYLGTVNTDQGDINVVSTLGSILETAPAESLVTGGNVGFVGHAVGDTSPIQTDAASLSIHAGSGGFNIHDIGDVVLESSSVEPNGSAKLSANGTLTLSAPLTTSGTGTIDLAANADFDAYGDLTQLPLADMNSAGGAIHLTVGNGVVGAGNMYLRTVNAQTGEIILTVSEGSVLAAEGALPLLISGSIDMRGPPSGNGSIGTFSNPIHVQADYLQATAGSGGISISTDKNLTITNLTTAGDFVLSCHPGAGRNPGIVTMT
ncbi:MAG: filamentous hemagglutinin N-terminal domain-containing protein, partial [Candidatus Omnitrophica bacterium]|nr:filamentous hemagglutinin N-terminal domain-containing protein [Candidatus Omnitrophota bacterium]